VPDAIVPVGQLLMHCVVPRLLVPDGHGCNRLSTADGVDSPPGLEHVTPDGGASSRHGPKFGTKIVPQTPSSHRHSVGRSVMVRSVGAPSATDGRSSIVRSNVAGTAVELRSVFVRVEV
jgi:hypothetical protein